ncbi:hypothetical protein GGX14DRAFT_483354 [Mycena pura]|uniref:Uncharacterized protein n=1 Tax=Mycena pura TaxID=153505 RepID=A0AAD6UQ48_9AGAR|nr:hypothetical protein GGX14DRAFT_483354 [Mycena pura]
MENIPLLPAELEREIFEISSRLYPSMIPTILCVARRVHLWIEPLLYRVLRVDWSRKACAFLRAAESKPPAFFAAAVRHVWIPFYLDRSADSKVAEALKRCTGVASLACNFNFGSDKLLPVLSAMRLQRLAVSLEHLFGRCQAINPAHPLFTRITHLFVLDNTGLPDRETSICSALAALPALTHLRVDGSLCWSVLEMLLANCARLEILVVLWPTPGAGRIHAKATPFSDSRFVVGVEKDYWGDWEAGAAGLPDFWTRAEEFVAKKRRGVIDAGCFWMED